MANFEGRFRSSYAKVHSPEALKAFCEKFDDIKVITQEHVVHGTLYGVMSDSDTPNSYWDEEKYGSEEVDFIAEMQKFIDPAWSWTFIGIGYEKLRYLVGWSSVVTHCDIHRHTLDSWYEEVQEELGLHRGSPQY